jgi:LuxR family maltose regulon positive regulatory protein
MPPTLLATKLYQPALAPKRVLRPHLTQRLNEGLADGRALTLVSAPAGFGKSTCVSEWLSGLERAVTWLSLDPADDDPERFFSYLVAAFQKIDPQIGREIEGMLQSGAALPVEAIAAALINDLLGLKRPLVLVLDDFQMIQDAAILAVIEKLVGNPPPQLHLVLITREDPLLPLARLRANNQMTEIRAGDLRFAGGEVARFLNEIMGLALSTGDIAALEDRTEGWIVGLQLAGLSMRGRTDPSNFIATLKGSHRYILSYLVSEVLDRQPPDVQDFLLQTSVLETLSGELCDAVTGRSDSRALLERLFNANLFLIPLDDEQVWYRYHHLFADLLRNQQSRLGKEQVAQLHQRATAWYEQSGQPAQAIAHALAGPDYPRAVALLERCARGIIMQGYCKTVEGWMQAIPPEWHAKSIQANLAFAWTYLLRGSYAKIAPYMKLIEVALAEQTANGVDNTRLQAEWLALQTNLLNVQGNPVESLAMGQRALQLAAPENSFVRGSTYLGMGGAYRLLGDYPNLSAAYQQAIQISRAGGHLLPEVLAVTALTLIAVQHGQLHFAVELGSQTLARIEQSGAHLPPILGTVLGALGTAYYEWNQIEKAREHFARAGQLSALSGHNAGAIYNRILMARLLCAEGKPAEAAQSVEEASELLQLGVPAWIVPEIASQRARIYLTLQNPGAAEAVLKPYGAALTALPEHLSYADELIYLAALRLSFYRAQAEPAALKPALALADRLVENATQARRMGVALQALLLRALIQTALGHSAAGQNDLALALELAEPEGYIRLFVDERPGVAELLRIALAQAIREGSPRAAYLQNLLVAFGELSASGEFFLPSPFGRGQGEGSSLASDSHDTERKRPSPYPLPKGEGTPPDHEVDRLSERELEVLALMARGLKYEEIAEQLVVTLNTVRFHVKSIYSKLHVNNRTQAIEAAARRSNE